VGPDHLERVSAGRAEQEARGGHDGARFSWSLAASSRVIIVGEAVIPGCGQLANASA
jgi:hypothetical protein